jgi:hypothetical protein
VDVLVICVRVFTVFCIACTVFFLGVLFRLCIFILISFVCTSVTIATVFCVLGAQYGAPNTHKTGMNWHTATEPNDLNNEMNQLIPF